MGFVDGLMKQSLSGLKYDPVLSLDERSVRSSEKIADILKDNRRDMLLERYSPRSTAVVPYAPPIVNLPAPEVNIDLAGIGEELARELTPAFRALIGGQRKLSEKVNAFGYIGQQTLQENQLQTRELEQLNEEAKVAFFQRKDLLNYFGESLVKQRSIRDALVTANGKLGHANFQLENIDAAIESMHEGIMDGLGEISYDIQSMTDEMVMFKLELFSKMDEAQAMGLWMHREKLSQLHSIDHALRSPRAVRALETWQFGEKARRANDPETAIRMYNESRQENPSESRNYTSLGLMSLEASEVEVAKDFFYTAAKYAEAGGENGLTAVNLLHLAKLESFERHLPAARDLLFRAHALDRQNIAIWVELARVSAELGDAATAREFVKAIVLLARSPREKIRRHAAGSLARILTDPFLAPFEREFV